MKKQILLVAAVMGFTFSNAQDLMSKDGHKMLPEAGDIGLGFDANPLFNYVGNMFNGSTGNSFNAGWENGNQAIMGKYFLDANKAIRGSVRLGFGSTTSNFLVTDDAAVAADPASTAEVNDAMKNSYNAIVLGGGMEFRRGHNRLQGYYGGQMLISLGGDKTEYTYGNAINTTTGVATTADFAGGSSAMGTRALTSKTGTFGFGLQGFIGVEYFFAPKISVSAEYGWGLGFSSIGDSEVTGETFNLANSTVDATSGTVAGASSFGIDTDNNGGAIRLMFHF